MNHDNEDVDVWEMPKDQVGDAILNEKKILTSLQMKEHISKPKIQGKQLDF